MSAAGWVDIKTEARLRNHQTIIFIYVLSKYLFYVCLSAANPKISFRDRT